MAADRNRPDRVAAPPRLSSWRATTETPEGLSITQIPRRLGRSPATVKAYFYDPTGKKAKAVKARYQGVCRGCGAPTQPRNGKGEALRRRHPPPAGIVLGRAVSLPRISFRLTGLSSTCGMNEGPANAGQPVRSTTVSLATSPQITRRAA